MSQELKVTVQSDVSGNAEGVPQSADPSASSLYVYKPDPSDSTKVERAAHRAIFDCENKEFDEVLDTLTAVRGMLRSHNRAAPTGWVENHPGVTLLVRRLYELCVGKDTSKTKLDDMFRCQELVAGLEVAVERK